MAPTMLCGRVAFITRSRHVLHCRSVLRSQNGPLHSKPELIFEHAELLAVNKPPGIPFHSTDNISGVIPTLRCIEAEGLLPHLGPLYPLHRLDKLTSGIMLLARSHDTAQKLSVAFAEGRVSKCYIALSDRKPKKKQGTIRGDMTKGRRGSWKLLHSVENPAVTKFTSFGVPDIRPGLRMFIVTPLTGRTHQIRVAMKSVGSPILGDTRYADTVAAEQEDRAYLHAAAITFTLEGQTFHITCQPNIGAEFLHVAFQTAWQKRRDDLIPSDTGKDVVIHASSLRILHPESWKH